MLHLSSSSSSLFVSLLFPYSFSVCESFCFRLAFILASLLKFFFSEECLFSLVFVDIASVFQFVPLLCTYFSIVDFPLKCICFPFAKDYFVDADLVFLSLEIKKLMILWTVLSQSIPVAKLSEKSDWPNNVNSCTCSV